MRFTIACRMGFNNETPSQPPALCEVRDEIAQGNKALRVLVVEDNRDAAESLRQLLTLCGFQVAVAHTGQQGLQAARRFEPHVVLCDIDLPDSDGYVIASILRQAGRRLARLIAVTAYGEPQHRRRALAAGFDL